MVIAQRILREVTNTLNPVPPLNIAAQKRLAGAACFLSQLNFELPARRKRLEERIGHCAGVNPYGYRPAQGIAFNVLLIHGKGTLPYRIPPSPQETNFSARHELQVVFSADLQIQEVRLRLDNSHVDRFLYLPHPVQLLELLPAALFDSALPDSNLKSLGWRAIEFCMQRPELKATFTDPIWKAELSVERPVFYSKPTPVSIEFA